MVLGKTAGQAACRVCSSAGLELISTRDRRRQALETVVCTSCGLVQHAQIPTSEELAEFYSSQYRIDYNGEATPSNRRVYREWRRGRERFDALRPFIEPGDQVFEVGSGIGCNLRQFENFGCSVSGIEPGEGFCQYSRQQLGVNVRCAFLEDLADDARQDQSLVLLVHVLEHLPDPVDALRQIRQLMRPDGHLFVEVPDFGRPHAAPNRVFHYGHIYNFTEISLRNVAHKAGFRTQPVSLKSSHLPNLAMVLTPDSDAEKVPMVNGYRMAVDAYHRYTPLEYHLRPAKLRTAIGKAIDHVDEFLFASSQVARLRADRPAVSTARSGNNSSPQTAMASAVCASG